jgi:hypothetical protein
MSTTIRTIIDSAEFERRVRALFVEAASAGDALTERDCRRILAGGYGSRVAARRVARVLLDAEAQS